MADPAIGRGIYIRFISRLGLYVRRKHQSARSTEGYGSGTHEKVRVVIMALASAVKIIEGTQTLENTEEHR